jgi:hypothetical protein
MTSIRANAVTITKDFAPRIIILQFYAGFRLAEGFERRSRLSTGRMSI